MLPRIKNVLRPWLIRRRYRAYGVGTARSGTHSLYNLFSNGHRSAHEPQQEALMALILDRAASTCSSEHVRRVLSRRDREMWLELDSSQLNYFILPELLEIAPAAKIILTIRDCRSWLTSYLDHQVSGPSSARWVAMRELRFRTDAPHPPEERALQERGLYTIDSYLSYWARHNRDVLESVPASQLLILRTDRIDRSGREVAHFLSIDESSLSPSKAHSNKAVAKNRVLDAIDPDYLEAAYERHCGPIMREIFPDLAGGARRAVSVSALTR